MATIKTSDPRSRAVKIPLDYLLLTPTETTSVKAMRNTWSASVNTSLTLPAS
jgi:hypothetical protein